MCRPVILPKQSNINQKKARNILTLQFNPLIMGNCVFKGSHGSVLDDNMVKVATSNGGIMELCTPITADCITIEFPGHGIYRSRRDLFSEPLHPNEELHAGELYHLLPLNPFSRLSSRNSMARQLSNNSSATLTPYRMSTYDNNKSKMWSETGQQVFPIRCNNKSTGVWKVKLVICPEQLSEILSQESRTEALIESIRTVAKCGNRVPSEAAGSDHWSVSSSWNTNGSVIENM
ncbi:uncharacterized protein LOC130732766 [Lotus japonicus]|uniref:uncharacterized protein LOC130732766 n=1 Tax=Lotus japonicus TaxID=34305 RepID=UPI00258ECD9A|nr:uncharacterized protein LOC130732766 [Lotus japonicus]